MSFGHVTMTQHDDNDASHVAVKYLLGNDFIYYRIKRLRNIHSQCRDEVTQINTRWHAWGCACSLNSMSLFHYTSWNHASSSVDRVANAFLIC